MRHVVVGTNVPTAQPPVLQQSELVLLWGYQAQMLRADLRNTRGTSDAFPFPISKMRPIT